MTVLLFQLDGSLPNIALMRIAAHHRALGHSVELRQGRHVRQLERQFWDSSSRVYASAMFTKSRPLVERLLEIYPDAIVGGTGWDLTTTLEQHSIETTKQDYSIYPGREQSIGFTQRGCRLRCPFCVVPRKEGPICDEQTIDDIWRGEPWPRELVLLDNDFFGQQQWRERIEELVTGGFRVSFNQGINVRSLTTEQAEAIASVDYRDYRMKTRRLYIAWDNLRDEKQVLRGLRRLMDAGVLASHLMAYMLIGFDPDETHEDRDYRRRVLRSLGVTPYPMPYRRTSEILGFQRWVVSSADKRIDWETFSARRWQLRGLPNPECEQLPLISEATT